MKKISLLFIALVAITSAKADLVVDSLGTVHMEKAELGLTDIDNANIENATASKINYEHCNCSMSYKRLYRRMFRRIFYKQ